MYAIQQDGALVLASPNAAAACATSNNGDKVIDSAALARLPDATIVALGVRRLVMPRPTPPRTYMDPVPSQIVADGDKAIQEYVYADMPLDQAKSICADLIVGKADSVLSQGVVLDGKAFATDDVSVTGYVRVGGARGAGIAYPAKGIPFKATDVSNGVSERVRLNQQQFTALAQAVQDLLAAAADAEDALLNAVEAAAAIDAVRAIDINDGWPAKE